MVLEPSEARAFYDRFGKKQDAQGFYEEPALKNLVDHAHFDAAKKVFEFGCGTGRFAVPLLLSQSKYAGDEPALRRLFDRFAHWKSYPSFY